ncbi:MAG TPA: thioredoxin-disulfide reductase [Clostridiales bacterium]|jgi:thioredoxin reductase (NADPH)|nr:thioredoxin-disulfide reductase [Clostridiales bacterium]
MSKIYDIIVIGAGPAGLAAGIYGGRSKRSTLILEKAREGGQIIYTSEIANYPGSLDKESGISLIERMKSQVLKFGAELIYDTATEVDLSGEIKKVKGIAETYQGRTVIIASGAYPISIGAPGEMSFTGRGVSYCATCDGAFFSGLEVFVVGGGDSAITEAIELTNHARKVTVIHRRDQLRAVESLQEKAFANPKIDFMWDSVVKELRGGEVLDTVVVENVKTGKETVIKADPNDGFLGVFVFIGFKPTTELFAGKIDMENGYILTDEEMRTNVPGVFAAGDLRKKTFRQVITAVADGALAAVQAAKYIDSMGGE